MKNMLIFLILFPISGFCYGDISVEISLRIEARLGQALSDCDDFWWGSNNLDRFEKRRIREEIGDATAKLREAKESLRMYRDHIDDLHRAGEYLGEACDALKFGAYSLNMAKQINYRSGFKAGSPQLVDRIVGHYEYSFLNAECVGVLEL